MKPRNTHLKRLVIALAATALLAPAAQASTARVQNLQAISGTSPATQPCELAAEYEPQIAVNPRDPNNIVAAWIEGAAQAIVVGVSKDGGRSWTQVLVPDASGCGGVLREDPRLAFDADGKTVYLASLCDAVCTEDPTDSDLVVVRRSTDGGVDWGGGHIVTGPIREGCSGSNNCFNAEVSITADPEKSGRAYLTWTRHDADGPWRGYFSQTTDGGDHWTAPKVFYTPPDKNAALLHDIRVLSDGSLLDVFVDYYDNNAHQVALHLSSDGNTLSDAKEIPRATVPDIKAHDPETGVNAQGPVKPAHDVAPNGTAYVAWQHIESATSSEILIAKSTDKGETWSELTPVRIESSQAFQPMLAIGPDGTIGVTYYDFREDRLGDERLDTDVWFAHSHDGGRSWNEARVAGPFNLRTAVIDPTAASFVLGEVDGLAATPDGFVADFVLAGPLAPEPPQDIFFARVSLGRKTTGGGWLADGKGGKLNFGFHAEDTDAGLVGELELNDAAPGVRIQLSDVTYLGAVGDGCGAFAGAGSLELDGNGTYNGAGGAGFRVCVQDNGDPGVGVDRFSLACTAGCSYTTGSRAPDDKIDGGNIRASGAAVARGGCGRTLILDPLLVADANGTLTVKAYDDEQQPLQHTSVTLTATTSVGVAQFATAVTGVDGAATFPSLGLAGEYTASVGCVTSNAVEVSAPLP